MQLIVRPCSSEHKQMQSSRPPTRLECTFRRDTRVRKLTTGRNVNSVSLSYNYDLRYCCCWEEFFTCQPYFLRGRLLCCSVRSPADRLNDRSVVRRRPSPGQTKSPWWLMHTSFFIFLFPLQTKIRFGLIGATKPSRRPLAYSENNTKRERRWPAPSPLLFFRPLQHSTPFQVRTHVSVTIVFQLEA